MSTPTNQPVPSSEKFKNALLAIRKDITPAQHKMLKAHCLADGHRLTATQLAAAADFAHYSGANLQYGLLGMLLGRHLGFIPIMRHGDEAVWTSVIATGESPYEANANEYYVWTMRPEIVEALMNLPWGINPIFNANRRD